MDRAGSFRCTMAADAAREGKLLEELAHPGLVFTFVRIDLRISALKIGRRKNAGGAVPRPRHEDGVEPVLFDETVEMDVNETQAWARTPMTEQSLLDMFHFERFAQQWIGPKIDHPGGQVIEIGRA